MRIVFLILILVMSSFSNESLSPYSLRIFGQGSYNLHSAKIDQLPGYSYCCDELSSGNGIGSNFGLGFEYKFDDLMFNKHGIFSFNLSYYNVSADLKKEEVLGNYLSEFDYRLVNAEYVQETNLNYFLSSFRFYLNTIENLNVYAGFNIGLPLSPTFKYYERSLEGINFQNGFDTVNTQSGNLPDLSPFLGGISVGARYKLASISNIDLSLDAEYNLGLTDVINSLPWTASSVNVGVSLNYNFRKPGYLPPPQPPSPLLPLPEAPKELVPISLNQKVEYLGKEVLSGNKIDLNVKSTVSLEEYSVLPFLFYEQESIEWKKYKGSKNVELMSQDYILESISKHLRNNPNVELTINSRSASLNADYVVKERVKKIEEYLLKNGIDLARLKSKFEIIEKDETKYQELSEEDEKISFDLSDNKKLVAFRFSENRTYDLDGSLKFDFLLNSNYKSSYENTLTLNDILIDGNNEESGSLNINEKDLSPNQRNRIGIVSTAVFDQMSISRESKFDIDIIEEEVEIRNKFKGVDGEGSQLILGYFNFDKSVFKAIDEEVLQIAKDALEAGKKVEILALTDNLGSAEHNENLANKRANTAKRLIGNYKNLIISTPKEEYFSNSHPYGRTLNRSILIKIYN